MKRLVALGLMGVVLASVAGCGGPDGLMKELIANLNLYAETIEKKDSPERQEAARDRVLASVEKIKKLHLSDEDLNKLLKRHESDLERVKSRLDAALKSQALEGGQTPPNILEGVLK
ncbi:MAG: hypothetical protein J0I06_02555 [Planctomycetes bacterium]|nr:hypothetical protein [Planctomycetota bacterium]